MEKVESSISATQRSLKDVNKLLKLDPTNTELLAQKQKLLKTAINETEDKLKALREADKVAKEQLESGDLGQDKYDALQREIIETEEQLKALKKTVGSGSAEFAKISAETEKISKKTGELANKLAPLSAAVTAVGAASVKLAADFEAGMDEVLALSGATSKEFEQLKEKAVEMGAKTKFSASESADAFKYMAMAGWDAESMLSGIEGIMNLAAASGEDLAATSDIVTDALTAFGMSAADSERFADVLAKTSARANTNVGLMGETFQYVAPVAGALGYSVEDTAVAIGLMANSGIKASNAGTALRSLLTNLSKPSDTVAAAMDKLGISLTDASGNMYSMDELMVNLRKSFAGLTEEEKANAAASLAGKTGMSGLLAIVNASEEDFNKLTQEINNANGAAGEMAATMMDNTSGSFEQLKGALESAAIVIGERLSPYIRQLAEFITGLVEKFSNMSDKQMDFVVKIGVLVAALAPVLKIVSSVAGGISSLTEILSKASGEGSLMTKAFTRLKTAFSTLFSLIMAHPVIAVITGIIAAIVLLYNKCDWFRNAVDSVVKKVSDYFKNLGINIKNTLSNAKNSVTTAMNNIKSTFQNGITSAYTAVTEKLHSIKTKFTDTMNSVKEKVTSGVNKIKGVFKGWSWSLPEIKLPHFKVSGGKAPWGFMGQGSLPEVSVSWYKKAMDNAYILNGASIFGSLNGKLLGGGESGSEMVVGTQHMMSMIQQATSQSNNKVVAAIDNMARNAIGIMAEYFPQFANMQMVTDTGALIGELTPGINARMGDAAELIERGN